MVRVRVYHKFVNPMATPCKFSHNFCNIKPPQEKDEGKGGDDDDDAEQSNATTTGPAFVEGEEQVKTPDLSNRVYVTLTPNPKP